MIYKLSLLLTCWNSDLQWEIDIQLSNIFNINSSKQTLTRVKKTHCFIMLLSSQNLKKIEEIYDVQFMKGNILSILGVKGWKLFEI